LIKDQKSDLVERIINWSLSVGRILVIVTELVALGAFLWRFGLDQQLVDLHSQIKQKQVIVDAFKKQEDQYRNLQSRLEIASSFSNVGVENLNVFKDIINLGATYSTFNKVSMTQQKISMEVNIPSVSSLSSFVNAVKGYKSTQSVSIDKIETKTSNAVIVVGITITLKPTNNKYATETQ
jgi:hypothetical protein